MSQIGLLGRIGHVTRRSRRVLLPNARELFLWFCCTLFALTTGIGQAAPLRWQPLGLSGGGGMFSPAISPVDPDLMILNCDMGAAYISADGGRNWRMIHHAQLKSDTRCRPGFHPSDANVIYASSRGQLRISRDRGKTFRPIGDLKKGLAGEIAIHPSAPDTMLLGTRDGHCWLSRDAGATWSVCAGPNGPVLGFHFDTTGAGRVMFAATEQGIWRSDDHGRTWRRTTHGLPSEAIRGFAGGSDPRRDLTMLYCTRMERCLPRFAASDRRKGSRSCVRESESTGPGTARRPGRRSAARNRFFTPKI